jgi:hypothetical protein
MAQADMLNASANVRFQGVADLASRRLADLWVYGLNQTGGALLGQLNDIAFRMKTGPSADISFQPVLESFVSAHQARRT